MQFMQLGRKTKPRIVNVICSRLALSMSLRSCTVCVFTPASTPVLTSVYDWVNQRRVHESHPERSKRIESSLSVLVQGHTHAVSSCCGGAVECTSPSGLIRRDISLRELDSEASQSTGEQALATDLRISLCLVRSICCVLLICICTRVGIVR